MEVKMTHSDSTDGSEFRDEFGGPEPASDTDAFGGPEPASDTDAFGGPEPASDTDAFGGPEPASDTDAFGGPAWVRSRASDTLAKTEDWLRTDPYPAQVWNGVTARVMQG
jgi:hypothetical protein